MSETSNEVSSEILRLAALREDPAVRPGPGVFDLLLVYEGREAYERALAACTWYLDHAASAKPIPGAFPWGT